MTDDQRRQCDALLAQLSEAGLNASLYEFRSVTGYRLVVGDGMRRRFLRDGEDPVGLLHEMFRLFGLHAQAGESVGVMENAEPPMAAGDEPAASEPDASNG